MTHSAPTQLPPEPSLKHKVFKGSLWSFVASAGRQGFGLIVFILLSRLLTPSDFGMMAMAVSVVEILALFVSLGLGSILIRHKGLTQTETSTSFWLCLMAGIVMSSLVFFAASPLAGLFKQPGLVPMLQWLSILPLLQSLTVVQESVLQRDMSFKALAMRTLYATAIAGIVSVAMALMGFGVYSLVFQRISTLLIVLVALWTLSPWRPARTFSMEFARKNLPTGLSLLFTQFLSMGSLKAMDIIPGFFLGPAAVGYYRVAAKLNDFIVQFLINPMVSVALASFSKVQDDNPALARMYRGLSQFCAFLALPAFTGMAALAPELITLIFGEKWLVSAQLMQILCLAAFGATLNYFFRPLMTALGRVKVIFVTQIVLFVLTLVVLTAAAQISIHAVMVGYVSVNLFMTGWMLLNVRTQIGLKLTDMATAFLPPVVGSVLMGAVLLAVRPYLSMLPVIGGQSWLHLLIEVGLGAAIYAAVLLIGFRGYVKDMVKKVRPLLKRKAKKEA